MAVLDVLSGFIDDGTYYYTGTLVPDDCPFCADGGTPHVGLDYSPYKGGYNYHVTCTTCGVTTWSTLLAADTPEKAIQNYNKRHKA